MNNAFTIYSVPKECSGETEGWGELQPTRRNAIFGVDKAVRKKKKRFERNQGPTNVSNFLQGACLGLLLRPCILRVFEYPIIWLRGDYKRDPITE